MQLRAPRALRTSANLALLLLAAIALQSCGFLLPQTSAPAAEPITIRGAVGFSPLPGNSQVLVSSKDGTGSEPQFLAAVRRCGINEGASLSGVARHLFVGLEGVVVQGREQVDMAGVTALLLHVNATIDDKPVRLVTASALHEHCVTDVALWWRLEPASSIDDARITTAQQLVTTVLSATLGLGDANHS